MQRICGEEARHEYLDQIFLRINAGLHDRSDIGHDVDRVDGNKDRLQEEKKKK
jgi:hypothetical protein